MKRVFMIIVTAAIMLGITTGSGYAVSGPDGIDCDTVFADKAAENLEEAIGAALKCETPTCDLTVAALEMQLNPYLVLLEIFKVFMDPEEQIGMIKEAVACAKTAEISDAIINQALIDAGVDPNEYGLGYTPPLSPTFAGIGGGRLGAAASPITP